MKIVFLLFASLLSSCSVMIASNKSGMEIDTLQKVCTREELIALGAEPIFQETNEVGNLVETYHIQKERGSIARAFMHGSLDLFTLFLWEFVGTPVEAKLSEKKFFSVKVTFDQNECVQKMELL